MVFVYASEIKQFEWLCGLVICFLSGWVTSVRQDYCIGVYGWYYGVGDLVIVKINYCRGGFYEFLKKQLICNPFFQEILFIILFGERTV